MKLELRVDEETKTFTVPFVSGRMLRKTLEISKNTNFSNVTVEVLDELVLFVVDLFKNQFTVDEFYDGIEASKLLQTVMDCIHQVTGQAAKALEPLSDPNA
ncbi:phage tail assembly chaperone G [Paenibacillus sp. S-38]|uniref:phage tail assembly chaperone G n=1 Tax=Paenibacillus sp. S-38 TaxID=3416710 RepID=UPI003CEEC12B